MEVDPRGKILVIMGASGNLAKKHIYPALWDLYQTQRLPPYLHVIGYGRTDLRVRDLKKRSADFMTGIGTSKGQDVNEKFWRLTSYVKGTYSPNDKNDDLTNKFAKVEGDYQQCDRIFYLALPFEVLKSATQLIKKYWMARRGNTRIVIEKPIGNDEALTQETMEHLYNLVKKDDVFLIDHYLCLEMVQSILATRFMNKMFSELWNNKHISSVMITFKEDFGAMNDHRFDSTGIVRYVVMDHMVHLLTLVAMEQPESDSEEHFREAKARLMKQIRPINESDVVLGQYIKSSTIAKVLNKEMKVSYRENSSVSQDSKTATFATVVLHVDNDRWEGVPFVLRAGKATNETKDEVRMQFKKLPPRLEKLFPGETLNQNEFIIQLAPVEKLALRINHKFPGLEMEMENSELDLNYASKYSHTMGSVGAYEKLVLSVLSGTMRLHTLGREELGLMWKIFSPLLQKLEDRQPEEYEYGSLGPAAADVLCQKHDFALDSTPW